MTPIKLILCVGACAWTTIFRVARVPDPRTGSAKIIPDDAIQIGDGMSASAGCAIVKLGGRAEFWARVGDDANGHASVASLREAGLDCRNVQYVPGVKGSFCTVVIDGDGERIVIPRHDPGAPNDTTWLHLDRIAGGEFAAVLTEVRWPEGAAAVLDVARAAGIPTVLDAEVGAHGVLDALARSATHVLYSETGLSAHVGESDVRPQLQRAQSMLPDAFVGVTRGAEGFFWIERNTGHIEHAVGVSVTAVDTLGAGDVFHGAYALGGVEGMSTHENRRFACVASLKCEVFGGPIGAPSRAQVSRYLV